MPTFVYPLNQILSLCHDMEKRLEETDHLYREMIGLANALHNGIQNCDEVAQMPHMMNEAAHQYMRVMEHEMLTLKHLYQIIDHVAAAAPALLTTTFP